MRTLLLFDAIPRRGHRSPRAHGESHARGFPATHTTHEKALLRKVRGEAANRLPGSFDGLTRFLAGMPRVAYRRRSGRRAWEVSMVILFADGGAISSTALRSRRAGTSDPDRGRSSAEGLTLTAVVALFVLPWKLVANPIAVNYSICGVGALKGGGLLRLRSWAAHWVGGVEVSGVVQRDAPLIDTTTLMGQAAQTRSSTGGGRPHCSSRLSGTTDDDFR